MQIEANFTEKDQILKLSDEIRQNQPTLMRLALANGVRGMSRIDNTKTYFKDSVYTNITIKVQDGKAAGYFHETTPKELKVDSTKNLNVGDDLRVSNGAGVLYLKVSTIDDINTIKVTKADGDNIELTTGVSLLVTPKSIQGEESADTRQIRRERTNFNYTQILRVAHQISRTEADIANHTTDDPLKYILQEGMKRFEDFVDNALLSDRRYAQGVTERYMGGLPYFIGNTFNEETGERIGKSTLNRVNMQGQKLSKEAIGDMFEYISNQGGAIDSVVCSTHVLRQLSELENNKVYVSMNPNQGTTPKVIGGAINKILNPIISGTSGDIVNYIPNNKLGDTVIFFKSQNFGAQFTKSGLSSVINTPGESDNYKSILTAEVLSYYNQGQETGFIFENVA